MSSLARHTRCHVVAETSCPTLLKITAFPCFPMWHPNINICVVIFCEISTEKIQLWKTVPNHIYVYPFPNGSTFPHFFFVHYTTDRNSARKWIHQSMTSGLNTIYSQNAGTASSGHRLTWWGGCNIDLQ